MIWHATLVDNFRHVPTRRYRVAKTHKLQIIFHKRATKYRSLLRKMTYKDKGSYESSPPCSSFAGSSICSNIFLKYLQIISSFFLFLFPSRSLSFVLSLSFPLSSSLISSLLFFLSLSLLFSCLLSRAVSTHRLSFCLCLSLSLSFSRAHTLCLFPPSLFLPLMTSSLQQGNPPFYFFVSHVWFVHTSFATTQSECFLIQNVFFRSWQVASSSQPHVAMTHPSRYPHMCHTYIMATRHLSYRMCSPALDWRPFLSTHMCAMTHPSRSSRTWLI